MPVNRISGFLHQGLVSPLNAKELVGCLKKKDDDSSLVQSCDDEQSLDLTQREKFVSRLCGLVLEAKTDSRTKNTLLRNELKEFIDNYSIDDGTSVDIYLLEEKFSRSTLDIKEELFCLYRTEADLAKKQNI